MTPIKPATPLPWSSHGNDVHSPAPVERTKMRKTVANCGHAIQDAAYIVHACNTYPQLVAERQQLIEALHNAGIALHVVSSKLKFTRNDGGEMANAVRIRALLRSLGKLHE